MKAPFFNEVNLKYIIYAYLTSHLLHMEQRIFHSAVLAPCRIYFMYFYNISEQITVVPGIFSCITNT